GKGHFHADRAASKKEVYNHYRGEGSYERWQKGMESILHVIAFFFSVTIPILCVHYKMRPIRAPGLLAILYGTPSVIFAVIVANSAWWRRLEIRPPQRIQKLFETVFSLLSRRIIMLPLFILFLAATIIIAVM